MYLLSWYAITSYQLSTPYSTNYYEEIKDGEESILACQVA